MKIVRLQAQQDLVQASCILLLQQQHWLKAVVQPLPVLQQIFDGDTEMQHRISVLTICRNRPGSAISAVTITPTGNLCTAASRLVSGTVVPSAGTLTSVTLNYSLNGTPQTGIAMTNTTGDIWEANIPASGNSLVTWSITAVNSIALSSTYSGGASPAE